MAKEVIYKYTSDISGKPDAGTVTFGFEDTWYEIELTADEKQQFKRRLKTYLEHAREASEGRVAPDAEPSAGDSKVSEPGTSSTTKTPVGAAKRKVSASSGTTTVVVSATDGKVPEPTETTDVVPDTTPDERAEIRDWADEEGYDVAPWGRIPLDVVDAYDKAHGIDRTYLLKKRKAPTKQVVPDMTVEEREKIREWAVKRGYEVKRKGRLSKTVVAAYDKAHNINRNA
ncbi:Lsr2 dimerization domain-containing protein [Amycolatopsis sp. CA-230715]|uniref:Lsr2 dimerization domain-containing protein n=1 Tax=Amycolatopsis sp. CA-230715 TaxID=2745196 RepID=UPI001C038BBB|nr:histone-like nucleoid-structuring protein Lsr2 [Amycolatopsis sp. CA-230715]QWF85720.1 hypothetical protein HUW46_09200 [Amycolatopsis sp. CA-230715]